MRNEGPMFKRQSLALVRIFRHFLSGRLVDAGFRKLCVTPAYETWVDIVDDRKQSFQLRKLDKTR